MASNASLPVRRIVASGVSEYMFRRIASLSLIRDIEVLHVAERHCLVLSAQRPRHPLESATALSGDASPAGSPSARLSQPFPVLPGVPDSM